MLKKLLVFMLVIVGSFTLAACGSDDVLTDTEKVQAAFANLSLVTETSDDLTFDLAGLNDAVITWESANEDLISNSGVVTQPSVTEGDQVVLITATITIGDAVAVKEFQVTVLATTELNDEEKVNAAATDLAVPALVSSDMTLPATGLHEVAIAWETSNADVLTAAGVVTNPLKSEGNVTVTLTATLSSGTFEFEKEFEVEVTAADAYTDLELLEMELPKVILAVSGNVEADFDLPLVVSGYDITWTSANEDLVVVDGAMAKVTRPASEDGNQTVVLTASISLNGVTAHKEFSVSIKAEEAGNVYASIADMYASATLDEVIEFQGIVTGVFDGGYFLSDGTHALGIYNPGSSLENVAIGDEIKVKGSYAVYNTLYQLGSITKEERISTGNANPLEGTAVVKTVGEMVALDAANMPEIHGAYFTVTGTVELRGDYNNVYLVDGDDAVLIYYYSLESSLAALEAEVGKEVTITVFYYTLHGSNGAMLAFDGAAEDISVNTLPAADALAADVAALEADVPGITLESVVLPAMGPNGTMFSGWTSSDTSVMLDDGTFVAVGTNSVTVTFTATATIGDLTETVTVDVLVPVNSPIADVLAMENGSLFQVTGVIYEMSYYGFYLEQGGDYIFVYSKQYDGPAVVGDEITVLGSLGEYNGLKQVNLKSDITINSSGNTLPTAINSTVEAVQFDLIPRGTKAIVTGTVSLEGSYNNVFLTGPAGGKIEVYYRSNAGELEAFEGQIITVEVLTYHDELVLYQLLAADVVVETGFTDLQKAQSAADMIDLGDVMNVVEDLVLPTSDATTSATITWATSDAGVVTDMGVITAVAGQDVMATLTATVTVGAEVATRDIMIVVLDANGQPPLTVSEALLLADGESVLVKGVIIGEYYDERIIQDSTGAAIYVDSNVGGDLGDEIVVRGTLGLNTSYGDNQRELNGATLVETLSTGNALVLSTETDPAVIVTQVPSMFRYTADLTVETVNDGFGYAHFVGDGTVSLKMKISVEAPYFEDLFVAGDVLTLTFTVSDIDYDNARIVSVVMPALTEAQSMLVAKGAVEVAENATSDLELPTEMYGVAISWASDNAAITEAGVVTRPENGAGNVTVTLTATFTIGALTETVEFVVTVPEMAPPAMTLFFSEYIEGGSNNKAFEIYNPNDFEVDLTGYVINQYSNGATSPNNTLDLTGETIAAGDVLVVYNSGSVADIINVGDISSSVTYFNGDDAIELVLDGTVVDVIGLVGEDPGSFWAAGDGTTQNYTIVRNPDVMTGVTVWDPTQWTAYAQDTFTYLGAHVVN